MRTATTRAETPTGVQMACTVSERFIAVRAGDKVAVATPGRHWLDLEEARELGATLLELAGD